MDEDTILARIYGEQTIQSFLDEEHYPVLAKIHFTMSKFVDAP